MSPKLFRGIALLTLPLALGLAYRIGRVFAPFLTSLDEDQAGLLTLLAYALGALVAVLVWSVLLWPLRRWAGFPSVAEEVQQALDGSYAEAYARERQALEARRVSTDPRALAGYHRTMALVGLGLGSGSVLLGVVLASENLLLVWPIIATLLFLASSLFHGIQYIRYARM